MLASMKLGADFSAGCALSGIRPAFLLTHPHHETGKHRSPLPGLRPEEDC